MKTRIGSKKVIAKNSPKKDTHMFPKIFLAAGGGIGDFIREYFRNDKYWGYLEGIKTRYPKTRIRVLASVHNPALEEFFQTHPYVDSVENYGWRVEGWELFNKYKEDYKYIKDVNGVEKIPWKKPEIYLTEEEQHEFVRIASHGKRIVIHPFGLRSIIPISEFVPMIDRLIDELKYTVVVVGKTHVRLANIHCCNRVDGGETITEEFSYERPGLINLVNKASIRLALRTVQTAQGFVGHGSCFNMMAFIHEIKTVLFSRAQERELITTNQNYGWPVIQQVPWCRNYFNDEWTSPQHVIKEAIEFFK